MYLECVFESKAKWLFVARRQIADWWVLGAGRVSKAQVEEARSSVDDMSVSGRRPDAGLGVSMATGAAHRSDFLKDAAAPSKSNPSYGFLFFCRMSLYASTHYPETHATFIQKEETLTSICFYFFLAPLPFFPSQSPSSSPLRCSCQCSIAATLKVLPTLLVLFIANCCYFCR